MKRLAFVDQMSDRPTNRRLIAIGRPTSYLDDQAKTKRCPADQHSSRPKDVQFIINLSFEPIYVLNV